LVADLGLSRRCHACDLMAAFPAETAPLRPGLPGDRAHALEPDRDRLPGGRYLGRNRRVCQGKAPVADAHVPPARDQRLCVLLVPSAERAARELFRGRPAAAPAPASAGGFHDLMDALVTEAKRARDLAQRGAGQLKPPDRAVKVSAGNLGRMLGVDDP